MNKSYFLHPEKKILKQGFVMEDEAGNVVFEAKVLKQPIIGAATVEFINHLTNMSEEHSVGQTVTIETLTGEVFYTRKAYFKFDGENIWNFLYGEGVEINSGMQQGTLSLSYQVFYEGDLVATISMTNANHTGPALIPTMNFEVVTEEGNIDLAFLVAYAIAKTEMA